MVTESEFVDMIADAPAASVLLLDFDGTLTPIVADPDEARLSIDQIELIHHLSNQLGVLAIVSGRPGAFLVDRLQMDDHPGSRLRAFGRAGLDRVDLSGAITSDRSFDRWLPVITSLASRARALAPEAWVEEKGVVLTLHWRRAPQCEQSLRTFAEQTARSNGLRSREGKMSVELFPPAAAGKGGVVRELANGADLVAYIGDDVGDLEAFEALEEMGRARRTVRLGVRSDEAPSALVERADLVLDSPAAVIGLLHHLSGSLGTTLQRGR